LRIIWHNFFTRYLAYRCALHPARSHAFRHRFEQLFRYRSGLLISRIRRISDQNTLQNSKTSAGGSDGFLCHISSKNLGQIAGVNVIRRLQLEGNYHLNPVIVGLKWWTTGLFSRTSVTLDFVIRNSQRRLSFLGMQRFLQMIAVEGYRPVRDHRAQHVCATASESC
jgi:hypothetical protein